MSMTTESALEPGFGHQVFDSTATFRAVLDAMSRPATVHGLPVEPGAPIGANVGTVAVLLALADMETPVWLAEECDSPELRNHLHFHSGCPIVDVPEKAQFAVLSVTSDFDVVGRLPIGTPEYPDRSATVIVECTALTAAKGATYTGPGTQNTASFEVGDAPAALWGAVTRNQALFPLGIDWIFVSQSHLAALPRTTKREDQPCM